jgi:hypothetical protein
MSKSFFIDTTRCTGCRAVRWPASSGMTCRQKKRKPGHV